MTKGLFITFEGNDGSGKTTQILKLTEYLKARGMEVCHLREPGGTPIGEKIRNLVLDKENEEMCAAAEMLLYAASRAQLVHTVIKPRKAEGKAVICDRFVDSSYAYQGIGRGLGLDTVIAVNAPAIVDCLPDLTFFMDVDADTAMKRRDATGQEADRIEREEMEFHRKVYGGYILIADKYPERIKRIHVNENPEDVFKQIRSHMEEFLAKRMP